VCRIGVAAALRSAGQTSVDRPLAGDSLYHVQTWQTDQGLPEGSATAMVQSADGALWFGTFNGLVRFDGVRFEVFDTENTPGLPASGIVNLHLDRSGRLWVSTVRGLALREGDTFRTVGPERNWTNDAVRSIAERTDGTLLFSTFDGAVHEYSGERFRPLPPTAEPRKGPVLACDGGGRWWLVQSGFLGTHDGKRWVEVPNSSNEDTATAVCARARDGGVWVVFRRSVLKYRSPTEVERRELPVDLRGLWSAFEDSRGHLWVSTHDNGLFRIAPTGDLLHWSTANGLTHNGVRFAFEDRERNIWIGTSGGGLLRFTERRCRTFGVESGIEEPIVNSVAPDDDGGLLVGTYGRGLFRLKDGLATRLTRGPGGGYVQSALATSARAAAGTWWVGTFGDGLFRIDSTGQRHVPGERTGGANVVALYEDSRGRLWVSGGEAVACFEQAATSDASRIFGEAEGVPRSEVSAFAEDAEGRIWISNQASVLRLEGDRFTEVRDQAGRAISGVMCFHADVGGAMWMGLRRAGLLRWRDGRVDGHIVQLDGVERTVLGIERDDEGWWWLVTSCGLVRAPADQINAAASGSLDRVETLSLGLVDGLATLECSGGRQPVCGKDATGRLWFATRKGVAMVDPHTFRRNAIPPPVEVEELRALGADRENVRASGATLAGGAVRVPAGSRSIEIRYTAFSFVDPERVRFQVVMSGVDETWRDVGSQRVAVYGNLAPGTHRFRVRAANNDGVWNETGDSVTFVVEPLLWQTWWFRAAAAVGLVAFGGGGAWWVTYLRERGRRQAEGRFRLALEAATSGMVLVDGEGRIVLVNAQLERSFGYDRQELIGQRIDLLVPARFAPLHAALREARPADPATVAGGLGQEPMGRKRDGTEFPIEIGINPIDTDAGHFALVSINDISQRKRVELEMSRQRNEVAHLSRVNMLGELSGSIAHELNQPLTAILSNAQAAQRFMRRDPVDLNEVREILDDIVQQNKRAGEVIHRLRTLLRKGEVQHERLAMDDVVREVLKLARSDLINHGVIVEADLPDELPPVRGDRIQLQQVLLNLVINACDVMDRLPPGERRLKVSTAWHAPGFLCVTVTDSGAGIPAEHLDQLFTPFFTTKGKGMGLGLAVCRTIVTSHAGEIWGGNNADRGASFHFTLPTDDGAKA
jgi:PAS domain S-box-containing protein